MFSSHIPRPHLLPTGAPWFRGATDLSMPILLESWFSDNAPHYFAKFRERILGVNSRQSLPPLPCTFRTAEAPHTHGGVRPAACWGPASPFISQPLKGCVTPIFLPWRVYPYLLFHLSIPSWFRNGHDDLSLSQARLQILPYNVVTLRFLTDVSIFVFLAWPGCPPSTSLTNHIVLYVKLPAKQRTTVRAKKSAICCYRCYLLVLWLSKIYYFRFFLSNFNFFL